MAALGLRSQEVHAHVEPPPGPQPRIEQRTAGEFLFASGDERSAQQRSHLRQGQLPTGQAQDRQRGTYQGIARERQSQRNVVRTRLTASLRKYAARLQCIVEHPHKIGAISREIGHDHAYTSQRIFDQSIASASSDIGKFVLGCQVRAYRGPALGLQEGVFL